MSAAEQGAAAKALAELTRQRMEAAKTAAEDAARAEAARLAAEQKK